MTDTRGSAQAWPQPWAGYRVGEIGHRRIVVAMTAAGIATFIQLYSLQAVLPAIAGAFDASAARVALTISAATGGLAGFVLVWSALADRFGRVWVMTAALTVSTVLGLLAPLLPELGMLLVVRGVQGAALGGVPAVAMAYLAEEIHPAHLARTAGVYIAGNTVGGMSGRLVAGAVSDALGWRWGVGADSALAAVFLVVFVITVPRARGFTLRRRAHGGPGLARRLYRAVADRALLALYFQGLFLMGAFVTVYNYLGFRIVGEPFNLSQTVVALLFVTYLAGTVASTVAGHVAERRGRYPVLLAGVTGMALTTLSLLTPWLAVVAAGLLGFTFSFFTAHAVAASWAGHRADASARAQATAIYTLSYYVGSSLFGWLGGFCYDWFGWPGVVGFVVALCVAAALAGSALRRARPVAAAADPGPTGYQ
ncbi:MFS transporter [Salinactinospora qingdaonensis]|uniref:MFS transporter n=1 Tax=Salinactinospora qingdaonensis TaxID=702744 RepID=A0ABP7F0A6_9ACTN